VPIYEYQCSKCGDVFEVIQKFSDQPLTKHEKCGGDVERLLSAPGIHFKGAGWYVTDYARAGSKKEDGKDNKKDDKGSSTETKSESKPAESKPAETAKSTD
jgi:putative FmdB family regulatory protein